MTAHHVVEHLGAMSDASTDHTLGSEQYEVRVQGRLESRWAAWFDGMTLTAEDDGVTCIHGPVADQAALHGLLAKLRDAGLPLVSVLQVEADQRPDVPTNPSR
jgi:hypothetical protein